MSPCPHCGALARVVPDRVLRWRCGVCGGPMVPSDDAAPRSGAELGDLVAAQRLRAMAVGWKVAAVVLGVIALMAATLAAGLWFVSHTAFAVLLAPAILGAALTAFLSRRGRSREAEAQDYLERAWQTAAAEVLRARGGDVTAAQLATTMKTDETHAEAILTHLSALGRLRVDVRDDAELAYRIADSEATDESPPDPARARG